MKIKFFLVLILLVSLISAPEIPINSLADFNKNCEGIFSSNGGISDLLKISSASSGCQDYLKKDYVNGIKLADDGTIQVSKDVSSFKLNSEEALSEDLKLKIGDKSVSFSKGLKLNNLEVSTFSSNNLNSGIIEGGSSGGKITIGDSVINLPKNTNIDFSTKKVSGEGGSELNATALVNSFGSLEFGEGTTFDMDGKILTVSEGGIDVSKGLDGSVVYKTHSEPIPLGSETTEQSTKISYKGHEYTLSAGTTINSNLEGTQLSAATFTENGIAIKGTSVGLDTGQTLEAENNRGVAYEYGTGTKGANKLIFEETGKKDYAGLFSDKETIWKSSDSKSNLIVGMSGEENKLYKGLARVGITNIEAVKSSKEYFYADSTGQRYSSGIAEVVESKWITGVKTTKNIVLIPAGAGVLSINIVANLPKNTIKGIINAFKRDK